MSHETSSDQVLIARSRQGDACAFDALVRRHYRAAYAVALGVMSQQTEAEDVCQDAWVRVLGRLEECRDPERFVFWLLQIVRNQARNRLAYRRVREAEPLEAAEGAAGGDARQDLGRKLLRLHLERALAELPEAQRTIVLLHHLEGWSHRAIADNLGISEVMSRQHAFQARRRLREMLGADVQGELNHDR